jgi:hypothetical protein
MERRKNKKKERNRQRKKAKEGDRKRGVTEGTAIRRLPTHVKTSGSNLRYTPLDLEPPPPD